MRLVGTKVMSVDFNKKISIIICCYLWYPPTLSLRASIVSPVYPALHCGRIIVSGRLGVAISTLVDASPMCTEIFIEICGNWITRLSLTSYDGKSRRPVGVLPATLSIFLGNKSHQFLIISNKLL